MPCTYMYTCYMLHVYNGNNAIDHASSTINHVMTEYMYNVHIQCMQYMVNIHAHAFVLVWDIL